MVSTLHPSFNSGDAVRVDRGEPRRTRPGGPETLDQAFLLHHAEHGQGRRLGDPTGDPVVFRPAAPRNVASFFDHGWVMDGLAEPVLEAPDTAVRRAPRRHRVPIPPAGCVRGITTLHIQKRHRGIQPRRILGFQDLSVAEGLLRGVRDRRTLYRREGPSMRRRVSGRLHLRGPADALHPARRVRRLRCLRARLPCHGHLRRGRHARRVEAVRRHQPGVLLRRRVGPRLARRRGPGRRIVGRPPEGRRVGGGYVADIKLLDVERRLERVERLLRAAVDEARSARLDLGSSMATPTATTVGRR